MKKYPCYYAVSYEDNEETVYGFLDQTTRHRWIMYKHEWRRNLSTKDPRFRAAKRQNLIIWGKKAGK